MLFHSREIDFKFYSNSIYPQLKPFFQIQFNSPCFRSNQFDSKPICTISIPTECIEINWYSISITFRAFQFKLISNSNWIFSGGSKHHNFTRCGCEMEKVFFGDLVLCFRRVFFKLFFEGVIVAIHIHNGGWGC